MCVPVGMSHSHFQAEAAQAPLLEEPLPTGSHSAQTLATQTQQGYGEDSRPYLLCLQKSLGVTLNHGFPHGITQVTVVLTARQVPVDGVRLAVLYLHREKPLVSTVDISQPLDKAESPLPPKAVAFQPSQRDSRQAQQPNGFSLP